MKTRISSLLALLAAVAAPSFAQSVGDNNGSNPSTSSGTSNGYSGAQSGGQASPASQPGPPAPNSRYQFANPPSARYGNAAVPDANAPQSSLNTRAMTPQADPSGASAPDVIRGYSNAVQGDQRPANAGTTSPYSHNSNGN